jgi:predicted ATPase
MDDKRIRLKKITISGYKSISAEKPLSLELGDINILLGANGSGKSNVFSFFKMLYHTLHGEFPLFIARSGTGQSFLHHGSKYTGKIDGELWFENSKEVDDIYRIEFLPANSDKLLIASEQIDCYKEGERNEGLFLPTVDFKMSGLTNPEYLKDKKVKDICRFLEDSKVYQFHDTSSNSALRRSSIVPSTGYLQEQGDNLASFLYRLKEYYPSYYTRIIHSIRYVYPQFHDFYFDLTGGCVMLQWQGVYPHDYILSPHQFSDGTLRFIALATLLFQPINSMPSIILIDEPELGLHPLAIDQLAAMLKDASLHTQIIVATQSPGLIDHFEAGQITVIERDDDGKDECTVATKLSGEDLAVWLENYALSELWEMNVIGGRP